MNPHKLHNALISVCPIYGVSIGTADDKATWRIDFGDAATEIALDDADVIAVLTAIGITDTSTVLY